MVKPLVWLGLLEYRLETRIRSLSVISTRRHRCSIASSDSMEGRFGPVRRVAFADVVYEDRWDEPYRDL
jgi:hypothetical protein